MANWETEFVKIIKEICVEEGIGLTSFDDWAFMLKKNGKTNFIYGYQFGLDNASVASIIKDKSAASEMMDAADIPHVPHWCIMHPGTPEFCTLDSGWNFLEEALKRYGKLVIKDNVGTGGRLVFLVKNRKELEKAYFEVFSGTTSLAVSPFVDIQAEYRMIMLDGEIVASFCKERPGIRGDGYRTVKELLCDKIMEADDKQLAAMFSYGKQPGFIAEGLKGDNIPARDSVINLEWKHNLGQGAEPNLVRDEKLITELNNIAQKVVSLFGLRFASVDIIKTNDGFKVLEINSGVMMENLAKTDRKLRKLAKETYRKAIRLMMY